MNYKKITKWWLLEHGFREDDPKFWETHRDLHNFVIGILHYEDEDAKKEMQAEFDAPALPEYDPAFGDYRKCTCGHPYYRHFDTYEEMEPVGCKYCVCETFMEPKK